MALSEQEKVQRDAEYIAVKILDLEEEDTIRFFDPDGREPRALASAVQALVGDSWSASVIGHQIKVERIIVLTPEDGEVEE